MTENPSALVRDSMQYGRRENAFVIVRCRVMISRANTSTRERYQCGRLLFVTIQTHCLCTELTSGYYYWKTREDRNRRVNNIRFVPVSTQILFLSRIASTVRRRLTSYHCVNISIIYNITRYTFSSSNDNASYTPSVFALLYSVQSFTYKRISLCTLDPVRWFKVRAKPPRPLEDDGMRKRGVEFPFVRIIYL